MDYPVASSSKFAKSATVSKAPTAESLTELDVPLNSVNAGASTSRIGYGEEKSDLRDDLSNIKLVENDDGRNASPPHGGATTSSSGTDTPKELWQDQYETFRQILPDADCTYLKNMAKSLHGKDGELRLFIASALENKHTSQSQSK